jgi:hypothetical protein
MLFRLLPADSQSLVEKKYSGWNGVLRAWVCSRWRCDNSFINWLNHCAGKFEKIHPGELVELVEFSTKVAQEDLTIELVAEDQAFDGISTDVAMADKTFSLIDEIIEKFNANYANAGPELEEMIKSLSEDEDLRMNVQNSAPSAYEYAAGEKLSERINTHMLDGLMTGNQDKVEYYNELSGDKNTQKQICSRIIRKIKDFLNLAG